MTCAHCGRDETELHRDDCRLALAQRFRDGVFGTDDDLFFAAFRAFVELRAKGEL